MLLKYLFKPKWQHPNADVRKRAIEAVQADTQPDVLREVALYDPEPPLRCLAVRKLQDLDLLLELGHSANNWEVRQLAGQRFQQLFAGQKQPAPSLEQRLERLRHTDDLVLLEYLALNAKEPELRLAVLEKVEQDALCGDVAINDPVAQNRLVAVQKITGKPTLERVVEMTRNRDKRVYRVAKEHLDALLEAEQRPLRLRAQREGVYKRLEVLFKTADWDGCAAEAERLRQQWEAVEGAPEPELAQRYQDLWQDMQRQQAAHRETQARQQALRAEKHALLQAAQALAAELDAQTRLEAPAVAEAETRLQELRQRWQGLSAFDDAAAETGWQQDFSGACEAVRTRLQTLTQTQRLAGELEQLCRRAEKLLTGKRPIAKTSVAEFTTQRETLESWPQPNPLLSELDARLSRALEGLRQRRQQEQAQGKENLSQLEAALKQLSQALEQGELQRAQPLEQQARELLHALPPELAKKQRSALEAELHRLGGQVQELRSWQHWGNKRGREQLCQTMESLVDCGEAPEQLAQQIKQLQEEWKKLSALDESHALWQRFHKASQAAYAPCQVYFAAQAEERQRNQGVREALCARLEQFIDATFAPGPEGDKPKLGAAEWRAAHQAGQQARKDWRQAGATGRKQRRELDDRFNAALERLDQHLEPERKRNWRLREGLVEQAKTLLNEADLLKAIDGVKQLQAAWQISVPAEPKQERALWKAFRAACDAVFERRDRERASERQSLEQTQAQKTALCAELTALLDDPTAWPQLPARLRQAEERWESLEPVTAPDRADSPGQEQRPDRRNPRRPAKRAEKAPDRTLDKRYAELQKRLRQVYADWEMAGRRAQLDALRQRAALCSGLEYSVAADPAAAVEAARQAWAALPPAADPALEQRFERACQAALAGQTPLPLDPALPTLCLHLEVLAGVESPPEAAAARMAYQVERLSRVMSGAAATPEPAPELDAAQVERDWHRHGGPVGGDTSLGQRFARACAALRDGDVQAK